MDRENNLCTTKSSDFKLEVALSTAFPRGGQGGASAGSSPVGDVPDELRQHVEERDEEIGGAEVHDHHVHSTQLLPGNAKNKEKPQVEPLRSLHD